MTRNWLSLMFVILAMPMSHAEELVRLETSTQRRPLQKLPLFVELQEDAFSVKKIDSSDDFLFTWTGHSGELTQATYIPGNKLEAIVEAAVEKEAASSSFKYSYVVTNLDTSRQSACDLVVETAGSAFGIDAPEGWQHAALSFAPAIRWSSCIETGMRGLASGELARPFILKTPRMSSAQVYVHAPTKETGVTFHQGTLPGVVRCWVRGYTGGFEAPEELPEILSRLIPRFPADSAVGPTVGPVAIPRPFDPMAFTRSVESYLADSLDAGWISASMAEHFQQLLIEIRSNLDVKNREVAKQLLSRLIRTAEEHRGADSLLPEAYALMKFNTEYLLYEVRRR